jgi:hypothetical protein
VDPGGWGRPPTPLRTSAALPPRTCASLPAWTPVGAPPLPPPPGEPPRSWLLSSRPPRLRQKRGRQFLHGSRRTWSALIEAALALVILTTLGLANLGGTSRSSSPAAGAGWHEAATPVITALIDDVTAAEHDAASPGVGPSPRLQADARRFAGDLGSAHALPRPSDPALASVWAASLQQLAGAQRTLHEAARQPAASTLAQARQALADAGSSLLEIGQDTGLSG